MSRGIKHKAEIIKKELLAPDIYRISFGIELDKNAEPGQFVMVFPPDKAMLLGRPLCVADASSHSLTIVFRTAGDGTRLIASCDEGDSLFIEGPLGNGYPCDKNNGYPRKQILPDIAQGVL